jgi:molybdenum-dependent DNA-binding transcriptional regulator ModE
MDLVAPTREFQGAITATRDQIIYQRRVRVLAHAAETGNVAETCRTFGISRTRFYEWRDVAERYGLEALMPKARRRPQPAERNADTCRRGALELGGAAAHVGLSPAR